MTTFYQPAEDSWLLWGEARKFLEKQAFAGMKILDMGTGSGFIIKKIQDFFQKKGIIAELWAADIVPIEFPGVKFVLSDLFNSISASFDLILFNPPYLPANETDRHLGQEKRQLIGGKTGNEVLLYFLEQFPHHLKSAGHTIIVASSLSRPEEIGKKASELGFSCEKIAEDSFFLEKIFVYLIRRNN